jgi:hypothetical protein
MKKIKELSYCRPGSCCPRFFLYIDKSNDQWLEITDDFGSSVKMIVDKQSLLDIVNNLFDVDKK